MLITCFYSFVWGKINCPQSYRLFAIGALFAIVILYLTNFEIKEIQKDEGNLKISNLLRKAPKTNLNKCQLNKYYELTIKLMLSMSITGYVVIYQHNHNVMMLLHYC